MDSLSAVFRFEGASAKEANKLAQELKAQIAAVGPGVDVQQAKAQAGTQDAGTLVSLLFDPAVIGPLAAVLTLFIRRNTGVRIVMTTSDGQVVAENLNSRDAPRIAEALAKAQRVSKKKPEPKR